MSMITARSEYSHVHDPPRLAKVREPCRYLQITYYMDCRYCHSWPDCHEVLADYETHCMNDLKMKAIPYNFVLSGDSEMYECRGWDRKSDRSLPHPELRHTKIDIGLVGDFRHKEPPQFMKDVLTKFIEFAKEIKCLRKDYILLINR